MFDARQFALNLISRNPNVVQNEKQKAWIDAIQNNDAKRGEEIATNLLNTYGVKKEDVPNIARQFFGL